MTIGAPAVRSRDLLLRLLAWQIQAEAVGGLDAVTEHKLRDIAKALERDGAHEPKIRRDGGWGFNPKMMESADWVAKAYADSVAMGSDLPAKPARAGAPSFLIQASKDPDGANLDRVQIIKIWLDGGIGAPILTAGWTDPEFDPKKPAVYYARTLEIPTARLTTLLALRNNLPIPAKAPATILERAWTSPIWFTPAKS